MKKYFACLLGVVLIATVIGCQPRTNENTSSEDQQQQDVATEPNETYLNNCASCHGQNLEGSLGPELTKIGSKLSQEEIEGIIQNGIKSMPAQPQVSGQAREKLAQWLAEKK